MSLESIIEIQEQKKIKEKELFKVIYDRAKNVILYNARIGSQACTYRVPKFIFGYPLIDIENTMDYISYKLTHKGFIVFPIDRETIYISWDLTKYKKNEIKKKEKSKVSIGSDDDPDNEDTSNTNIIDTLIKTKLKKKK